MEEGRTGGGGSEEDVALVTEVLQAQERLHLRLKAAVKAPGHSPTKDKASKVLKESTAVLDNLRQMKSCLEGSDVDFEKVCVGDDVRLQRLRQLMLMHVPGTMTPEVKDTMGQLVQDMFGGSVEKVLCAVLITCPWYRVTQEERGQQAKHNCLLVLYLSKPQQFLAPVNPQLRERDSELIDMGWLYAAEVFHFAHYLVKGKARFVEAMYAPQSAMVLETDDWVRLREAMEHTPLTGVQGFLEQCRGQAVGCVGKKRKHGGMKLKDDATLQNFCNSFRLLYHSTRALNEQCLVLEGVDEAVNGTSHSIETQALELLRKAYSEAGGAQCKPELFELVMSWRGRVDDLMKANKRRVSVADVNKALGGWMAGVRGQGVNIQPPPALLPDDHSRLHGLMERCGGIVKSLAPENILLMAQAGSHLYGLATPSSDVDFVVIYKQPTQLLLGACGRSEESMESRGPQKAVEYGAYEARLLTEMLWKGSVVMLELVFAKDLDFVSPAWKDLQNHSSLFVTERSILQYLGLIKNNMVLIEGAKHQGTSRERKLFYQIFHKLYCLEYFLKGQVPDIKCTGKTRDFIMKIRHGPLEGDISKDILYGRATEQIQNLKKALSERKTRLPENVDYQYLSHWLMDVRGWTMDS